MMQINNEIKISTLVIVLFIVSISFGQTNNKVIPLHKFLQDNFDSTIVYNPSSNWDYDTEYLIISKLNGFVLHFTYLNPYKPLFGGYLPRNIGKYFLEENMKFTTIIPDTNRYFLPKTIYDSAIKNDSWANIINQNIWSIKDDKILGVGCGDNYCSISDADQNNFYLITKAEIKKLNFYAPAFYLKNCCSKKESLKEAVNIIQTFKKTFGYNIALLATTSMN